MRGKYRGFYRELERDFRFTGEREESRANMTGEWKREGRERPPFGGSMTLLLLTQGGTTFEDLEGPALENKSETIDWSEKIVFRHP